MVVHTFLRHASATDTKAKWQIAVSGFVAHVCWTLNLQRDSMQRLCGCKALCTLLVMLSGNQNNINVGRVSLGARLPGKHRVNLYPGLWKSGLDCTALLNWCQVAFLQNSAVPLALLKHSTHTLLQGEDHQEYSSIKSHLPPIYSHSLFNKPHHRNGL